MGEFARLKKIVKDLRGPAGCPWDQQQTHRSLVPYALEETHELVEAIEFGSSQDLCEELGDHIFQAFLHAQIAEEEGKFTMEDVLRTLNDKLVRRHPHVFSGEAAGSLEDIWKKWNETKASEKPPKAVFNFPITLSPLQAAQKIGRKSQTVDFFWKNPAEILSQIRSELEEVEEQIARSELDPKALQLELGDVLFTVAQLAQILDFDADQSLRAANQKFMKRFEKMLELNGGGLKEFSTLKDEQKEELWKRAKSFYP